MALLELPSALSEEQLSGAQPLPPTIPLTPRLQGVFRVRIVRLSGGDPSRPADR
jgi:hypothetical protein